jgi:MFS family permease
MGKQDASWRMKMPATGVLICAACWAFVFADLGATATVAALVLGGALLTFHIGPTFALVQSVAPTHMRALAASLLLFVSSFVGFGLGPLVVGRLSDALSDDHGIDSLRIAMLLVPVLFAWAALHYYAAARALRARNDDLGDEPTAEASRG